MGYQQIMTPFLEARAAELSFLTSLALARGFKAHIDVVHMRQRAGIATSAYTPYGFGYASENFEAVEEALDQTAAELESLLGKLCARNDVKIIDRASHSESQGATASWRDLKGFLPYDLTAQTRLADLVVVAKPDNDSPTYENGLIEDFIFQSGRPLLIANTMAEMPKTIVVAWNGGREAARAISAALPMLQKANDVFVVSVGEPPYQVETPLDAVNYLRLHGVHASPTPVSRTKGKDDEATFLDYALAQDADLIVMGGYSHSRWRQIILGGFTRHLLKHSPIPLFIAH